MKVTVRAQSIDERALRQETVKASHGGVFYKGGKGRCKGRDEEARALVERALFGAPDRTSSNHAQIRRAQKGE